MQLPTHTISKAIQTEYHQIAEWNQTLNSHAVSMINVGSWFTTFLHGGGQEGSPCAIAYGEQKMCYAAYCHEVAHLADVLCIYAAGAASWPAGFS